MTDLMIRADGITKTFGRRTVLDEVSLGVPRGTVLGLLGHNGAGKTTMVGILTTTLPADGGRAAVGGHDVAAEPARVRSMIGLTGQYASVDEQLTGYDNLVLLGRLLGAGRRGARTRADELLELFDLVEAARRPAKTYSGGMRRRLDLAAGLVGHPSVLFLDEPTTGLDPVSRLGLWETVETLVDDGATVLLTTQYLEEADRLAGAITVLSSGRVVASGTPAELKASLGTRTVTVTPSHAVDVPAALGALDRVGRPGTPGTAGPTITVPVERSPDLAAVVRALDEAGIDLDEVVLAEPTLDDVYLSLAAHPAGRAPATSTRE